MIVLPVRIEHALYLAIERAQHTDPREHRRSALYHPSCIRSICRRGAIFELAVFLPCVHLVPRKVQAMRRLFVGPDWSSWILIVVIVLLVCGLVLYWLSLAAV